MPTTRAARRAAAAQQLLELPADVLGHVLYYLTLAHDIALVGLTCRALRDAAKLALKARPFSGEVVTLAGHGGTSVHVAATRDGHFIAAAQDGKTKVWRDGVCVRTIEIPEADEIHAVVALPGNRFVCGDNENAVSVWSIEGVHERTIAPGFFVWGVTAMPDGEHIVICGQLPHDVVLYNVDGTLVHTFKGHDDVVNSVAATPDGQHIISGSDDTRQGVERRQQEPCEHLRRAHQHGSRGGGDARRPALP